MSDTIQHSFGGETLNVELSDQVGCLVRIYPAEGACGMWNLDSDEVYLGRGYDCDIHLDDDGASRRHAAVQRDNEGYVLVDLKSTNGTYVNNQPVTQHRLLAGDRIRIGSHVLKFLSADHIELQYHETVFRMTTRDGLTQAHNRQYMNEFLERELLRSKERGRPISVALLDIDHFKQVNDTHGHLAGDEVLRELCERAEPVLHAGDLFARYGGEEFCAVFCESDQADATELAEKIRLVVGEKPFSTSACELDITVSVGVATWNGEGEIPSPEGILDAADKKLYEAKESGRNRVLWSKLTTGLAPLCTEQ